MNKKIISTLLVSIMILTSLSSLVSAQSTSEGTTTETTVSNGAPSINLCTKVIQPAGTPWGMCDDAVTHGTFRYKPSGSGELKYDLRVVGLGGGIVFEEVSDLDVVGVTESSITWRWTNPVSQYFIGNIITVIDVNHQTPKIEDNVSLHTHSNQIVNHVVSGLLIDHTYRITVKSVYDGYTPIVPEEYSLIYYKDVDQTHTAPNGQVEIITTKMSTDSGTLSTSGKYEVMGGIIPAVDDKNHVVGRGKIWLVPTNKIKSDMTIDWTGYTVGYTMPDYLYEEDKYTTSEPCTEHVIGLCTIPYTMGGITFP